VLDFENTAEDIEKGFQPFYDRVTLSKETDANQIYNIRTDLDQFASHEAGDLEAFGKEWFSAKQSVEKLQGVVNPVAKKWMAEAEEDRVDYKSKARDFVKLYSFLSHLVPLRDAGLEKLFVFLRFLLRCYLARTAKTRWKCWPWWTWKSWPCASRRRRTSA